MELDLVASSLQRQPTRISKMPTVPISPDEAIAKILDYSSDPPVADSQYRERTQPDGHDENLMCEKTLSTVEEVSETEIDSPEVSEKPSPVNKEVKVSASPTVKVQVSSTSDKCDKLDGMLDSITQDLEYLLNNSQEVPVSTLKRIPKSPISVKHAVSKEVFKDDKDGLIESVTIRSKC